MAIKRKRIKIEDLFNKLDMLSEETTWKAPKSLKVLSENNNYENVSGLYKTDKREVITSYILDERTTCDTKITGVPEHRVKVGDFWTYLKDLQLGDNVIDINNSNGTFLRTIKNEEKENCYDLQVDNTHSFYTNDILSHNTEMFLSMCNLMKIPTLILFARIDLAHQTLKRMKKAGIDAGIVQGNNIDEDHLVVMATVQSGHKLKNKYDMVIVDECHRAGADKYIDILSGSDFIYRFGFSATPWVKDKYKNAKVKSFLGSEIFNINPEILIEKKRIAKPKIHVYPITQPRKLEDYKYMGAEKHGIVNNKYRNKLIARLCEEVQGQILVLIKKIDQGKNLEKLIEGSYFLSGESKAKERTEVVKRFDGGEEFVLIASTIFDEGISIDNVNHVFIAGGGASFIKALQRIGRGTRITKTKKDVDIYDFWDATNPTLLRHSRERVKIYKNYGYTDIETHTDEEVKTLLL